MTVVQKTGSQTRQLEIVCFGTSQVYSGYFSVKVIKILLNGNILEAEIINLEFSPFFF